MALCNRELHARNDDDYEVLSEYCQTSGMEKLEWCDYKMVKKFDNIFSNFDEILVCDRQTDRHLATA